MCVYRVELESKGLEGYMSANKEKFIVCPHCEADYLNRIQTDHGTNGHNGVEWFACPACGKSFYTKMRQPSVVQTDISAEERERCFNFYRA